MVWSHKARMHWVCNDVKGLSAEVRKWNNAWYCDVVDMETGEVLKSWNMSHPPALIE